MVKLHYISAPGEHMTGGQIHSGPLAWYHFPWLPRRRLHRHLADKHWQRLLPKARVLIALIHASAACEKSII